VKTEVNILLVAKPWSGGLARYLHQALQEMFPGQVTWLPTYPATIKDRISYRCGRKAWKDRTIFRIREQNYDAVLFVNAPSELAALDRRPEHVLWITDAPPRCPAQLAPYSRIFLSDEGYAPELLTNIESDRFAGVLPFAHHPPVHRPQAVSDAPRGVCFIGNRDRARDAYLAFLFRSGLHPTVVGNYFFRHRIAWRYPLTFRPAISNTTMGRVYAAHCAAINIHAAVVRRGTNMRTFECAGYGIPQVIDHRPGIEKYFDPGRECLTVHTPREMAAQVRRLLQKPATGSDLKARARRRVLAEHTYYHRIASLLNGLVPEAVLKNGTRRVGISPV